MVAAHAPHQRGEANRRSDAIKRLLTLAALGLTLAAPATSHAAVGTPRSLISVHAARDQTWHWQDLAGHPRTTYGWLADRHTTSSARRWQIATAWWDRAAAAHATFQRIKVSQPAAPAGPPASFVSAMACIGLHEEGGQNSVAGYFGFVYPPGSYGPVDAGLVGTYGSSWLNWPRSAQLAVAYMLYQMYGWSPWTTAPGCGL